MKEIERATMMGSVRMSFSARKQFTSYNGSNNNKGTARSNLLLANPWGLLRIIKFFLIYLRIYTKELLCTRLTRLPLPAWKQQWWSKVQSSYLLTRESTNLLHPTSPFSLVAIIDNNVSDQTLKFIDHRTIKFESGRLSTG